MTSVQIESMYSRITIRSGGSLFSGLAVIIRICLKWFSVKMGLSARGSVFIDKSLSVQKGLETLLPILTSSGSH